jgi:hypothetical protein
MCGEVVMARKRVEFVVSIEQPEGASVADLKAYVKDAVGSWCGQFRPPGADGDRDDPGDSLWGIGQTVKVKRLTRSELRALASMVETGLEHVTERLGRGPLTTEELAAKRAVRKLTQQP